MNTFGKLLNITLFGESHSEVMGIVIDGIPAGVPLTVSDFEADLGRRRGGSPGTTTRQEADRPQIVSGWYQDYTTGAPLTLLFENRDGRSADYAPLGEHPRPSHADFTARQKFRGYNDPRGGGAFSGRMTLPLVGAGVVAKKILGPTTSLESQILEIGGQINPARFAETVAEAQRQGDSVGGIVACTVTGLPIGLGEPFFNSVESVLSHLLFAIPGIKGVEFGAGFDVARMRGSQCNDQIISSQGNTATNHAGGINGGITNGNPIHFKIAVRPTPSIAAPQETYHFGHHQIETLSIQGRHDACIALRLPVILEAVTAIALADLVLQHKTQLLL